MGRTLVTGGAGFIGSNLSNRLLSQGKEVTIFDDLSRKGVEKNLEWLRENHPKGLNFIKGDIRNFDEVKGAAEGADTIFHTAAQVAVTDSLDNPKQDFDINALGAINVLEAARKSDTDPVVLFTSTNKVYGNLADVALEETKTRHDYKSMKSGVPSERPIAPHTPYGCSKGAADSYMLDYARIYGLRTVTFRMSCIYGTRQFGTVDQGWVMYFLLTHIQNSHLTIYGDGKQVRDVLFIDDLVNAFEKALEKINKTKGKAYSIGGGPDKTLSLLELISFVEEFTGKKYERSFADWRPGDQKVYYSDLSLAKRDFEWAPSIAPQDGVKQLYEWITSNPGLFK